MRQREDRRTDLLRAAQVRDDVADFDFPKRDGKPLRILVVAQLLGLVALVHYGVELHGQFGPRLWLDADIFVLVLFCVYCG